MVVKEASYPLAACSCVVAIQFFPLAYRARNCDDRPDWAKQRIPWSLEKMIFAVETYSRPNLRQKRTVTIRART